MKNQIKISICQLSNRHRISFVRGFTLVELLVVIAIIGVMTGVITVSVQSSIARSKRASALTSASSVLPELVTCQDDEGVAATNPAAGMFICCTSTNCGTAWPGHTATWPNITTKTQWIYGTGTGTLSAGNYTYYVNPPVVGSMPQIKCKMASSECCDVGTTGC